jgi:hypothetical protein
VSRESLVQIYLAALPPDRGCDRAEAEQAVAEAVAKVEALRLNGDLKQLNSRYKIYRQTQMERREPAIPYSVFLERRVVSILRQIAAARMI